MQHQRNLRAIAVAICALSLALPLVAQKDTPDPGPSDGPTDPFSIAEHGNVSCSLPLLGNRTLAKYAPVMYGGGTPAVANFTSVVVVNNPDSMTSVTVEVSYYNGAGTTVSTALATIPPFGTHREQAPAAVGRIGSVRVRALPGVSHPIVGAVLHYADQVTDPSDPDHGNVLFGLPYLASMQPLQELQRSETVLNFGPIPIRAPSPNTTLDLVSGLFGVINLVNPAVTANNITVTIASWNTPSTSFATQIPAGGSLQILDAWKLAETILTNLTPNDDRDLMITVTSQSGLALVGELLMLDLASDANFGGKGVLHQAGGRTRMSSVMPGYVPRLSLFTPEITVQNGDFNSVIGIGKVSGGALSQVTIQYFDANGVMLPNADFIPSFGYNQVVILGPGMPMSPNFPTTIFKGSARITNTAGSLVGWTMRGSEGFSGTEKHAYADLLFPNGGSEHKTGWLDLGWNNANAPLAFDNVEGFEDPGYVALVNSTSSNLGFYRYAFFNAAGSVAGVSPQYVGLAPNFTSLTYEDPFITLLAPYHSGRVLTQTGAITGIATIGGELTGRLSFLPPANYVGPGTLLD